MGFFNPARANALGNLAILASYPIYKNIKSRLVSKAGAAILGDTRQNSSKSMPYRSSYSRRMPMRRSRGRARSRRLKRKVRSVRPFMSAAPGREYLTSQVNDSNSAPARANLNAIELIRIPRASSIVDLDARKRDTVFLKGTMLRWRFSLDRVASPTPVDANGIIFCWAVVIPKSSGTPSNTDLLRGFDADRGITLSTVFSHFANCYNPINTDNYIVLRRGRHKLYCPGTTGSKDNGQRASTTAKKLWIPLNTKVNFNGASLSPNGNKPYFIYWYDINGRVANNTGDLSGAKEFQFENFVWYKDIN